MKDSSHKQEPLRVFTEDSESPQKMEKKSKPEREQEYSQFPSWDLLPPFKLVDRRRRK